MIGWALERTLEAHLAVGALRMALGKRTVPAGLIHHSDRGVQYACGEYTQLLGDNQIRISMSRKGNPYDNARAESFMKTLKHEQVHREEYRNIADARRRIGKFLESTRVSFLRNHEDLTIRVRKAGVLDASRYGRPFAQLNRYAGRLLHDEARLDESSSGDPSAGCSPAEPASVSPTMAILLNLNLAVHCFF